MKREKVEYTANNNKKHNSMTSNFFAWLCHQASSLNRTIEPLT